MKYLNNKNTGEVIKITKPKETRTYYRKYENRYFADNDLFGIDDYADARSLWIVPEEALNEKELIDYTSKLKVAEKESAFVLDTDAQNWLVIDRLKRLIVKNSFLTDTMLTDDSFRAVIDKLVLEQRNFIYKGKYGTVVYINEIDAPDLPAVLPYIQNGDIIIENKIV